MWRSFEKALCTIPILQIKAASSCSVSLTHAFVCHLGVQLFEQGYKKGFGLKNLIPTSFACKTPCTNTSKGVIAQRFSALRKTLSPRRPCLLLLPLSHRVIETLRLQLTENGRCSVLRRHRHQCLRGRAGGLFAV